jgi:hypothetical protein
MYPGRYERCIDRIEKMEPVIPPVSRHGLLFLDKLLKGWQDAVNLPSFVEKTAGVFESWMQGGDDTDRDGLHVVGL